MGAIFLGCLFSGAHADILPAQEDAETPREEKDILSFFEHAPGTPGFREEFKRLIVEAFGRAAAVSFKEWGLPEEDGERILIDLAEQAADCVILELATRESAAGISIEPETLSSYLVLFDDRAQFRDVVFLCIGEAAFDAGLATRKDAT